MQDPNATYDPVSTEEIERTKRRCCNKACCGCALALLVAAVIIAVFFVFLQRFLNRGNSGPTTSLRIGFVDVGNGNGGRRLAETSYAHDLGATVESLEYSLVAIRLCKQMLREPYTMDGIEYAMFTPDHSTCADEILPHGEHSRQQHTDNKLARENAFCAKSVASDATYVDMKDPAALREHLSFTAQIQEGVYGVAEVTFLTKVKVKASVRITNGSVSKTLYTKRCGEATCDSSCRGAEDVQSCSLTPVTKTNPFSPSHSFDSRCEYDLTTGPSEMIRVTPYGGRNDVVSELLVPITFDTAVNFSSNDTNMTSTPTLILAFNAQDAVRGKAVDRSYYGVTDGFYNILLSPLTLVPIFYDASIETVKRVEYHVFVRRTGVPYCMNGTVFGKDGTRCENVVCTGKCHPTHKWETTDPSQPTYVEQHRYKYDCVDNPSSDHFCGKYNHIDIGIDQATTKLPQNEQEYNLRVDLFYIADMNGVFDKKEVRAASVAKFNAPGLEAVGDVDFAFMNMVVSKISLNPWDNGATVNLEQSLMGQGIFPRIRDFTLLDHVNQTGTTKVLLERVMVHPLWPSHSCHQMSNCLQVDVYSDVFFEFQTKLVAVSDLSA